MNTFRLIALVSFTAMLTLASCGDDEITLDPIVSERFSNLHAEMSTDYSVNPPVSSGDYIKFNFSTGQITTGDDWDVAFRGTTILVNGGTANADDQPARTSSVSAYLINSTLADVASIDESKFEQDGTSGYAIPIGSGNGWYNYDPTTHLISPIAGKVIIVKTHNNRFAKMEILSYYKDAPTEPDGTQASQYYTFDFVYQPNENVTGF